MRWARRLSVGVEPLPHGNAPVGALRAQLRDHSPEERVAEAWSSARS